MLHPTQELEPPANPERFTSDAAGIIATLFALSHLSFRYDDDELAEGYGRLYEHAADHAEAAAIFQAID